MERWILFVLTLPSPLVVGFWEYVTLNPAVMDDMDLVGLFFAVTFYFGPFAGVGAFIAACRLAGERQPPSYLIPCLVAGATAFAVNGMAFVFYIAPGC